MADVRLHSPFPIASVREQFPALGRTHRGRPVAYLDGPGGSQVCRGAIDAVRSYMERGGANLHGQFATSHETEENFALARRAMADLLSAQPEEIAFGPNMTTLCFSISRALARTWRPGDEVVVTEMDHFANVSPWVEAAKDRGVTVRTIPLDPRRLTLDLTGLDGILTERTRVVAVGLASNGIGAVNDVAAVARAAHERGAIVAVDAVHAVPHFLVERDALGADVLLCSAYKFFGPHVGVACIRRELFEQLRPYKVLPAPDEIPDKLETGTQNHEGLPGVTAAVEFIASLGAGETRRERIRAGYEAIEAHEGRIAEELRENLAALPGVTLFTPKTPRRTPTIALAIDGASPLEFCRFAHEEHGIFVADGHFYAVTLGERTGVNAIGGWIRAGLAPYSTDEEGERLLTAVREYVTR